MISTIQLVVNLQLIKMQVIVIWVIIVLIPNHIHLCAQLIINCVKVRLNHYYQIAIHQFLMRVGKVLEKSPVQLNHLKVNIIITLIHKIILKNPKG